MRTLRSQALTVHEQVLIALRYYATGSMQLVVADTGSISQPSVSRALSAVTDALVRLAPHYFTMPTSDRVLLEVWNLNTWIEINNVLFYILLDKLFVICNILWPFLHFATFTLSYVYISGTEWYVCHWQLPRCNGSNRWHTHQNPGP
jgi:hypothetical protein